ncbi:MAG: DUF342 domain-containing protein [Candidatus Gracilibacteria bacterium]|nr:DUF342 domain-containing protein [Candidatus Gracilibacteria bacterium]
MNTKILMITGILISCLSFNTTYAEKYIGSSSRVSQTMTYHEDLKIGSSFSAEESIIVYGDLDLGSNTNIQKDLIVYGNLEAGSNINIGGNVIVTGNIDFSSSGNVEGYIKGKNIDLGSNFNVKRIYAQGFLETGSSVNIAEGIEVFGNADFGSSLTLGGHSKITGNVNFGSSTQILGTIYIYENADFGSEINMNGGKIKILKDIEVGSSSAISGRLYLYGNKNYKSSVYENMNNFSGFMGSIDPFLIYSLSDLEINNIKNTVEKYLSEAKINPNNKDEIYKKMFRYLDPYIETESFDREEYGKIKKQYIGEQKNSTNIKTNTSVIADTGVIYTPILTPKLEKRLNYIFSRIPAEKKTIVYTQVIHKIELTIMKLKKQDQTSKIVGKINLLLGIQKHIKSHLENLDEDTLLEEIGL